nr:PREDICTED: receptor like protein 30-like [Daucus carota subsp. sativus]
MAISAPSSCNYGIFSHPKTMNWSMSTDYCTWEGVTCDDKARNVIGLDLSCSQLVGAILPNNTLFQLSHLQFLDLSWNDFSLSNQFPQEFGFFATGLEHLNLSHTRIPGRVPSGISHLYKLVSLDLSRLYNSNLDDQVFKLLLQNLTQLQVINLEWVNISSVVPVNLSTSLRVLNLYNAGLYGVLPREVFHLPNLEVLDLSLNSNLTAILPDTKWGSSGSLQNLHLLDINVYGGIPDSIGFLGSLATLSLVACNLSGPIPRSIGNLSQLTDLQLGGNNLIGQIPEVLANHTNLRSLDLSYNSLSGPVPSWLFNLTSLESLGINYNRLTGELHEFDSSKLVLRVFSCGNNLLFGSIPQSFSQLVNLTQLDFSSNNFSGDLDLAMFSDLVDLKYLDLSHNSLSVRSTSMATLPPKLYYLGLSSCKMKEFPHISENVEYFVYLDLSNNQIDGEIPRWIGTTDWLLFPYVNLSHNHLIGGLEHLPWNTIWHLDLQSNMLNGSLPSLICNSTSLRILNLSYNKLSGVLPICQTNLTRLTVFDLRMNNLQGNIPATLSNFRSLNTINLNGNNLEGRIPSSFSEFGSLEVLDLGRNQINDTFPQCLEALPNLQVLVLKSNKFHGHINQSSMIKHPFPSLRIIDLSYNEFSGPLPTMYFENFVAMMNGSVDETYPTYMGEYYYKDSTGLVIKGAEIKLERILTIFTTIDVSRNNFTGDIVESIGNLVSLRFLNISHNQLTGHIPSSIGKLSKLESLDLSLNQLEGEIPQQLTGIYTLARLNLSCNQLTGHIPQGSQFNTFENDSYVGNLGLCGYPLSKKCEKYPRTQGEEVNEDDDYFFSGFTWEAVVIGYGCGVVPAFIIGYFMLLAGKPKWYAGIIASELGLKIRRVEIKWR